MPKLPAPLGPSTKVDFLGTTSCGGRRCCAGQEVLTCLAAQEATTAVGARQMGSVKMRSIVGAGCVLSLCIFLLVFWFTLGV